MYIRKLTYCIFSVIYLFIFYNNVSANSSEPDEEFFMPLNETELLRKLPDFNIAIQKNLIWIEKLKSKKINLMSLIDVITQKFEIQDILNYMRRIRNQIRKSYDENLQNKNLKRHLDILTRTEFDILPVVDLMQLNELKIKWNTVSKNIKYCSYDATTKCDYNGSFIEREILNTNIPKKIKWYWNEWLQWDGKFRQDYYLELITLFQKAANRHGFTNIYDMFTFKYEMENITKELNNEMKNIFPFYENLHGYIRNYLQVNKSKDAIPDYLLHKLFLESYEDNSKLNYPIPNAMNQTRFETYNNTEMFKIIVKFYNSMGFNVQNIENIVKYEKNTLLTQFIDTFGKREQIFKIGTEVTEYNFHRTIVEVLNFVEYNYGINQTFAFQKLRPKAFRMAIANAIVLCFTSPKYLVKHDLIRIENSNMDKKFNATLINKLYRMALQIIIPMQKSQAVSKNIKCLQIHKEPFWQINDYCNYWKDKYELLGVSGEDRLSNFDVLTEKTSDVDDDDLSEIFSIIVGFQIFEELCKQTGHYSDESPEQILANCDFSEDVLVNEIFKKVFIESGSKPWQEHFKHITQSKNAEISTKSLLKYFEPLNDWLLNNNNNNSILVGWYYNISMPIDLNTTISNSGEKNHDNSH